MANERTSDDHLALIAKNLGRITRQMEHPRSHRGREGLISQITTMERERRIERRADWALRFAAITSVAAILTGIATLVAVLT